VNKPAVYAGVAIMFAFMVGRGMINDSHPVMFPCADDAVCRRNANESGRSIEERRLYLAEETLDPRAWLRRDLAKTPLRLAALAACLLAIWRLGGAARWGWHLRLPPAAVGILALELAMHVGRMVGAAGSGYSSGEATAGVLATIPVALWEEACYRSLLYLGLRKGMSPLDAAIVSCLLFTFMHWGAMPVEVWGYIFLTGFAMCAAFELGAGLPWLVLSHCAVDAMWIFAMGGTGPHLDLGILLCRAFAFLLLIWSWWVLQEATAPARVMHNAGPGPIY